jgi:chromosome segregation ATPase
VTETLLNQQESKLEPGTNTQRQNRNLKRIVGIILSLVMISLTGYVLYLQNQNFNIISEASQMSISSSERATANYRAYVEKYKTTKIQLDETTQKLEAVNRQLDQVTAELATTKGMLSQTQGMLASAQDENVRLKQELQVLDQMRNSGNVQNPDALQAKITALKDRDTQVSSQLADLKTQLRAFNADISTAEEGRTLITLFQSKINLVKIHMRFLRQQAFFAKVAAQKEKDRLAVLNGNTGFVIRNGQPQNPNGTKKSFDIDVKIVQ